MKGREGYKFRSRICKGCGRPFSGHMPASQVYCTQRCYHTSPKPTCKTGREGSCALCGVKVYKPASCKSKVLFCGSAHANEWQRRNKLHVKCKMCGKAVVRSKSLVFKTVYCTQKCRNEDPDRVAMLAQNQAKQQAGMVTTIERIGYALLDALGVTYLPQHVIAGKFCVDAYLPDLRLVVQFDGDYWHGHPLHFPAPDHRQTKRMKLDVSQDAYLRACGYEVARFWESDLHQHLPEISSRLQQLAAERAPLPVSPA